MRVLTGLDHAHHTGDPVQRRAGDLVDRPFDRVLHLGVQRGADQITAAGHLLLADARPRQVVQHIVAEKRPVAGRNATAWQLFRLGQHAQRLRFRGAQRLGVLREVFDHGVQHDVSPLQRRFGIGVGVQRGGRLHHARQQRGLLPVQSRRVDAEVRPSGILHPERAVTEDDQIEVAVGTALSSGPPHRSQRAELPHWAPASDSGVEPHVRKGMPLAGGR